MKSKMTKAAREADKTLKPLIRFAASRKGVINQITREMERLTGQPHHRQQVEMWLHKDPERRTMAGFGTGLLLLKVWDKLNREDLAAKGMAPAEPSTVPPSFLTPK